MLGGRTRKKSQAFLSEIHRMTLRSYQWDNQMVQKGTDTDFPAHKILVSKYRKSVKGKGKQLISHIIFVPDISFVVETSPWVREILSIYGGKVTCLAPRTDSFHYRKIKDFKGFSVKEAEKEKHLLFLSFFLSLTHFFLGIWGFLLCHTVYSWNLCNHFI